jgi:HEAT repeat protein
MCNKAIFVNKPILLVFIAFLSAGSNARLSQKLANNPTPRTQPEQTVEQMRGFSMQLRATARSDGRIDPIEQRRQEITARLHQLGKEALPALSHALSDNDVQMRRNVVLVLINLAGGYSVEARPKLDIRDAIPELIHATEDGDSDVRAWAAHALAEIGPDAKEALPALLKLLKDHEEGPRITSCLALGNIGPAAKDALPALKAALNDPSKDVRRFAEQAIEKIQKE